MNLLYKKLIEFKSKNIPNLYFLIFLIANYISFLFQFLTFDIVNSPDFDKYFDYFNFFGGFLEKTNLEQGLLYFFLNYVTYLVISALLIGEKYFLINYSILFLNNLLFLIGLRGLYLIFNLEKFKTKTILITFTILNFLPMKWQITSTFKPEILAFCLICWILYYLYNINYLNFIKAGILCALVINTKASIAVMVLSLILFFIIFNFEKISGYLNIKSLLLISFLFLTVFLESSMFNGLLLNDVNHDEKYNNKANFEFFVNTNSEDIISNPNKYFHYDSFINITLFDSFNDFFQFYWNSDNSLLSQDRKEFIKLRDSNDSTKLWQLKFNKEIKEFTFTRDFKIVNQSIKFDNLRMIISYLFSGLFFTAVLFFTIFTKKFKLLIGSPILGMFIIVFSALGFFGNNFDPNLGDSIKVFYYSFFILISFTALTVVLLSNLKYFHMTISLLLITLFLFFFRISK